MNFQRFYGLMLLSLLSFPSPVHAVRMDGLQVRVEVTPDEDARKAGESTFQEDLQFDQGKLKAVTLTTKHFIPAPYEAVEGAERHWYEWTQFGPSNTWRATLQNDHGETLEWQGVAIGLSPYVKGTLTDIKPNGKIHHFTFDNKPTYPDVVDFSELLAHFFQKH